MRLTPWVVAALTVFAIYRFHANREIEHAPGVIAATDPVQRDLDSAAGIERGEFRQDIDPRVAATVVYGGIDELLTAWVLDRLPAGEADVAAAEKTFFEINLRGLQAN